MKITELFFHKSIDLCCLLFRSRIKQIYGIVELALLGYFYSFAYDKLTIRPAPNKWTI